jgi:hypothetical protein
MRILFVLFVFATLSACASSQCQEWNLLPALAIAGPTPAPCPGGQPTVTRAVVDRIKVEYLPKGE